MNDKLNRTGFRWTFETAEGKLAACPICGEREIERIDKTKQAVSYGKSWIDIWFKCGHKFNGESFSDWLKEDDEATVEG